MIVLVVVVLLVVGLGVGLMRLAWSRSRPPELRGDWWKRFERDFRAYAQRRAALADGYRSRSNPPDRRR